MGEKVIFYSPDQQPNDVIKIEVGLENQTITKSQMMSNCSEIIDKLIAYANIIEVEKNSYLIRDNIHETIIVLSDFNSLINMNLRLMGENPEYKTIPSNHGSNPTTVIREFLYELLGNIINERDYSQLLHKMNESIISIISELSIISFRVTDLSDDEINFGDLVEKSKL